MLYSFESKGLRYIITKLFTYATMRKNHSRMRDFVVVSYIATFNIKTADIWRLLSLIQQKVYRFPCLFQIPLIKGNPFGKVVSLELFAYIVYLIPHMFISASEGGGELLVTEKECLLALLT